jgi:heavy metal translocating P-type ATPase
LHGRAWPGTPAAAYCCYGCLSLGEADRQAAAAPAGGWKLDGLGVRLGLGVLVAGQGMIFGLALNLHDDVPEAVRDFVQNLILAGTLVVTALLGGPLLRAARADLRRGRVTTEALFVVTLVGALAASLQAHLTGRGSIYYEVVSVLLVVYTVGKLVGARARAAAVAGSRAWAGQLDTARLVDEKGRTRVVPVAEVLPGDVAEVYPGESVPVDGVVRAGVGFVSEAPVSGEPFPVVRRPGDRVLAGAAAYDATFHVEATAAGTARQVDRLLAAVEAARDKPVSFQGQADRLAAAFLPLVVLTALGTFGYWALLTPAGWEAGLFNALSVLLVACPCALGLATPVVVWSALGRLAERGLVVRSGDTVERLAEVDRVLFDKTGTLTDDRFALVDVVVADGWDRATVLGWVAAVEAHSRHPVARAFAGLPAGAEVRVTALRAVPGCGVEAEVETPGRRHAVRIGRPGWVGGTPSPAGEGLIAAAGQRVAVSIDGQVAAVAVVAERLRDAAPAALAEFARLGLPVEVLTGDAPGRAEALGLPPARAGLLPDDKRRHVEELTAGGGKPLVVGDGINDAAALAAAHVGVALSSGTDLAVGAADATFYHADLRVLPWAVELSRAAVLAVRRNLLRAVAYNLVGMALAAGGVLHPVVAALLMVASSLSLLFSATRFGVSDTPAGRRCHKTPGVSSPPLAGAVVHGSALALQGVVALLLLESAREPLPAACVLAGFGLAGLAVGYAWCRWAAIPHDLDMAVGMLTLGNLGMLGGWWADAGFAPLTGGCCACAVADGAFRPWMWVGMLGGANAAMLWLGRRPLPRTGNHVPAMFTGGNAGMVLGMLAGGWTAAQLPAESVPTAAGLGFAGMTLGMVGGMLLGTWLAERLLNATRAAVRVPRWRRAGPPAAGRTGR